MDINIKTGILENVKALLAISAVASNSFIQWLSDADTVLKVVATALAIPTAIFAARFMYYQGQLKKLQIERLQKEMIRDNSED